MDHEESQENRFMKLLVFIGIIGIVMMILIKMFWEQREIIAITGACLLIVVTMLVEFLEFRYLKKKFKDRN